MSNTTLPTTVQTQPTMIRVAVNRVRFLKGQPRRFFDGEALIRLGKSLKRRQRQPIKVHEISDDPNNDYELNDGERRLRAARLEGLEYLNAIIVTGQDAREQYVDSLVSNFCREDYTPLEKAEALRRLRQYGYSEQEMSEECGIDLGWVRSYLSLLKLVPEVQALMDPERQKEERLPLRKALMMVEFSRELQLEVADELSGHKKINSKQTNLIITHRAYQAGEKIREGRTPNRDYNIVMSTIDRAVEDSNFLVQLPQATFVGMMASRDSSDLRNVSAKIDTAIENFRKLKDKVATAHDAAKGAVLRA